MDADTIGLALRLLDDQLVDAEQERFGRVDDIELDGDVGRDTRVAALLVGPGAWRWRVPRRLSGVVGALTPSVVRRVPWELVRGIRPGALQLSVSKGELGFGTAHHASARFVDEVEHQTVRLSALLGALVVTPGGDPVGRVREVRARFDGSSDGAGTLWLTGAAVGRSGLAQRLVGATRQRGQPSAEAGLIEWSRLRRGTDGGLVLSS